MSFHNHFKEYRVMHVFTSHASCLLSQQIHSTSNINAIKQTAVQVKHMREIHKQTLPVCLSGSIEG